MDKYIYLPNIYLLSDFPIAPVKYARLAKLVLYAALSQESKANHRTKAAIEAGIDKITCLATDDELTHDQKIAIQLSQNAIVGQDAPATLKLLYESVMDIEMKKYCGLDDKTLELLDKITSTSIAEANLEFKTLHIIFLPDELEFAQKVIDSVKDATKTADASWLVRKSNYDDWLDSQECIASSYGVKKRRCSGGYNVEIGYSKLDATTRWL